MEVLHKMISGADDVQLFVESSGNPDSQAIIFLHGGFQTSYCWYRQQSLADRFHTVFPHLRGHGRSGKPHTLEAYSQEKWAQDLDRIIEDMRLERPVLCVNSYSGIIVGDYLEYGKHPLGGIIFIDAIAPNLSQETIPQIIHPQTLPFLSGMLSSDQRESDQAVTSFVSLLTAQPMDPADEQRILQDNLSTPLFVRQNILLRPTHTIEVLHQVDVPTLILQGRLDRCVSQQGAELIAQHLKGMQGVEFIDYSGHFPFYEQADLVNKRIEDFLSQEMGHGL